MSEGSPRQRRTTTVLPRCVSWRKSVWKPCFAACSPRSCRRRLASRRWLGASRPLSDSLPVAYSRVFPFHPRSIGRCEPHWRAVLLIFLPLAHQAVPAVLRRGIVLVCVDLFRQSVLLVLQLRTVGRSQLAIVRGAHAGLFLVHTSFLRLQLLGLSGCELAALDAIGDAILLIFLAMLNGRLCCAASRRI